jgi:hypothetical protein
MRRAVQAEHRGISVSNEDPARDRRRGSKRRRAPTRFSRALFMRLRQAIISKLPGTSLTVEREDALLALAQCPGLVLYATNSPFGPFGP